MSFTYEGFDIAGKAVSGAIEASAHAEAIESLRRRGIFAVQVQEDSGRAAGAPNAKRFTRASSGKVTLRELSQFFRQLSILVATKTPLVQALEAIEKQSPDGGLRTVLSDVRLRVEQGETFSSALAAHPRAFDPICRSMIAAGESAGLLDQMLKSLAALARQRMNVRRSVVGALTYPGILITVSFGVVIVLLVSVLPQFSELFDSLQTPLPPTTQFLIALSEILRGYWFAIAPGAIVLITAIVLWLKSDSGWAIFDAFLLKTPRFGPVRRSFAQAGLTRLLGTLLESRVNLLDALRLTRESLTSAAYINLLLRCEAAVEKGQPLAESIGDPNLISPSVKEAIASGERSGQIGPVLIQVADFLDEDNDQFLKILSALIEPIVLTIMGVLVGGVAISMFLPMFDLAANAGGGPAQ
ncbi:MAG: type II secretion system F family protein [Phycisphaeraceae bacterium]|nr:type II secretion system F family protein [Phycisphaeraceae bacterium]